MNLRGFWFDHPGPVLGEEPPVPRAAVTWLAQSTVRQTLGPFGGLVSPRTWARHHWPDMDLLPQGRATQRGLGRQDMVQLGNTAGELSFTRPLQTQAATCLVLAGFRSRSLAGGPALNKRMNNHSFCERAQTGGLAEGRRTGYSLVTNQCCPLLHQRQGPQRPLLFTLDLSSDFWKRGFLHQRGL